MTELDYSAYVENRSAELNKELDNFQKDTLKKLSFWALKQKEAEKRVSEATDELKKAEMALRDIAEKTIPDLMKEAHIFSFVTTDGLKIKLKDVVSAKISENNQDAAFAWLEKNDHGNLIKREFKISFNKDEEQWAKKFEQDLRKRKKDVRYEIKRAIPHQTLSAFVREQLAEGVNIPLDTFGVFKKLVAKVDIG